MNSLSWLLYLADVIGNLSGVFILLAFIFGGCTIFWGFAKACAIVDNDEGAGDFARAFAFTPWLFVLFLFLSAVTPSKDTIYLIAGSEAGEAVVTSEAGQEILTNIQDVIKYQIQKLKSE